MYGSQMGFEIHSEENSDYFAKLSVWEWSRFLDLLLFTAGAINMETMLNNIVHVTLLETQALTQGKDPDEVAELDITEHKVELYVNRDENHEVNRMEILDMDLPDGRKVFHGAALKLKKDEAKNAEEYLAEMALVSIAVFQHMEDKMFAAREKMPCFRELGRNGTLLKGDDIWALYDCMLNMFSAMEMPDMLRMVMFPNKKRIIPKFTKEQGEAMDEFVKENIQPHDLGNMPRLFGVISQTIASGEDLRIS